MIASSEVASTASLIGSSPSARIVVLHVAQKHVLPALFPAHHAVADRLAAVTVAGLRLLDLRHPEHLLAELFGRESRKRPCRRAGGPGTGRPMSSPPW